ncbi:MAG: adenylate/guanylate cyclase domain-containing protein [Acidimicrobiales bacterium]
MTCGTCGAVADANARFCASCGRPLRALDDERRVVTVVFADLVGFTSLSERLDPERVKNLVDRCFDRLATEVTGFGGQVDKLIGDAMVALFGAPTAHEDDAERAVRAALRMQDALAEESEELGEQLRLRIGVNTGEVLVGAMRAAGSVTAMGDVVNTASRLQTAAGVGEVLVGPATHATTHHTIAYQARGLLAAKGREAPVDTWVAVAPTLPPGYRARRVDVPMLGRDDEVTLLRNAISSSIQHRRALLVLLVGDVGMGKSRLADEVASWSEETHGSVVREGRCIPYGEANVWWPIADALRSGLGLTDGVDAAGEAGDRAAVEAQLATVMDRQLTDPEVGRTADGLLTLLGYDPPADVEPAAVREEAARALGTYVGASAALRPVILQLSDLHWADEAVLDLVDDVFSVVHHQPLVLLATARPALLDRWTPKPGRHNSIVLHLDPLGQQATADLLEHLVGAAVPDSVAEAVVERSGGNPFFLEELVSLLDGDATADPGRVADLPDTLRGLVAVRLDDLSPAVRVVVQDASVIGRHGPMEGLREMARQLHRHVDVDAAMAELVLDEIMGLDDEFWSFRSDLLREVAYQMITKADRAQSHFGIAQFIEGKAGDESNRPPWVVDQLAHHYGAAVTLAAELGPSAHTAAFPPNLADRARRWVVEAADRASRDQALPNAMRLYEQALELLGEPAPPTHAELASEVAARDVERDAEAARLHRARARVGVEVWDMATARRDMEAAYDLAEIHGDQAAVAQALVVRGTIEQHEGDPAAATATLTRAVTCFADLGDDRGLGRALRERAMVQILEGAVDDAAESATDALAVFERTGDNAGQGWALQHLAWVAFVSGRLAEADHRLALAMDRFTEMADSRGLAWSRGLLSWVRFHQRRVAEAASLAEEVREEAEKRNDPWASALMDLLLASIRLWSGRTDEAVEMAESSLRAFSSIKDPYGEGLATATLGRALVMAGRVHEGFELMTSGGAPDGRRTARGPADGQVSRFARLSAAAQIGEPERAHDLVDELATLEGVWGDDPTALLAMIALQRGDLDGAAGHLPTGEEAVADANLGAVRALYAAASGRGGAAAVADGVAALAEATYLDHALAEVAAALEAAGPAGGSGSDASSVASRRFAAAHRFVDGTEDRVAHAFIALAEAAVAHRLDAADADELASRAERLVAKLDIDPVGWERVFALALGATATAPGASLA